MSFSLDFRFQALGTLNTIRLNDCHDKSISNRIVERVQEIDDHMSAYKQDSDIARIMLSARRDCISNSIDAVKKVEEVGNINNNAIINTDTLEVLERALWFYGQSQGAFDITIRPLTKLWGIGKKNSYIPPQELIDETRRKVNASRITIDKEQTSAGYNVNGGSIDLGGIAKGYAADEVKRIIVRNGITSALINLGGNIVTVGMKPDGSSWKVGIQNPLAPRGEYLGVVEANDRTVVTSGSYEQFFIKDKIRYHHIIDPRTGYPAQSSLYSVTAICEKSIDADALTTSLFILGYEEGMELVDQVGSEAIFITDTMEVRMTKGLANKLHLKDTKDKNRRNLYVC
ncbi:MAG TPA: FAD:protein FMN transferase [Lachnospiraceae bacterium]|nr:FAD:protein FMN transferase [Lachnospiraceae bacterium]